LLKTLGIAHQHRCKVIYTP